MAPHEEAARFLNMINEAAANNARGGEDTLWTEASKTSQLSGG
jgi:hypothetical protein